MFGAALIAVAFVSLAVVYLVVRYGWHRRGVSSKKAGPRAVIVVSDDTFELPCVATAAAVFDACGLEWAIASCKGRSTNPESRSLDQQASKRAAERADRVWYEVLDMVRSPAQLLRLRASEIRVLFIAGGPHMLADLRQTDLSGSSPTPFCIELRRLAAEVHTHGGAIGAVGHGVHGLPGEAELSGGPERRLAGRLGSAAEDIARRMFDLSSVPAALPPAK